MNIYNTRDFNDMFDAINKNFNSFFNDSSFLCLSAHENLEDFVNSLNAFVFIESNWIVEKSDQSMSRKNVIKRKVI